MRMLPSRIVTLALVAGCASVPAPTPQAPAPVGPEVARLAGCPSGARVVFREVRADGSQRIVGVHCGRRAELEIGEVYEWGEGGSERIEIGRDRADAIWRVTRESRWREWETCESSAARPRFEVEVDDGSTALMYAHCDGHLPNAWRATLDALRAAEPEVEPFEWPFDGDYWRDELGYYRTANR